MRFLDLELLLSLLFLQLLYAFQLLFIPFGFSNHRVHFDEIKTNPFYGKVLFFHVF